MGSSRRRPIVGRTDTGIGAHYIIVEAFERPINVQVTAEGTVTFTVDWTVQNVLYDVTGKRAVNVAGGDGSADQPVVMTEQDRYIPPANAVWNSLITSGSADAQASIDVPVFAIRIDITVGTGAVAYHITQG